MEEIEKLEKERKLTAKQEKFCQEYILCLNQTEAYQRAYETKERDTARKLGARLMANDTVKKRVEELKAELILRYDLKKEQVLDMAMWVYNKAKEGTPQVKLNREGRFVPTGNTEVDFRACNEAIKNIASICGFNSTNVKAEVKAEVESEVNVITAKDIAKELMKND